MDSLQFAARNLASPPVLAFALGSLSVMLRKGTRLPARFGLVLGSVLLLAIGFKGGVALANTPASVMTKPIIATLILGGTTPLLAFWVLRRLGRFERTDAAALAAHYGSVSAVTFTASLAFLQALPVPSPAEGFMPALVALLEIPAIAIALLLARGGGETSAWGSALKEIITGKSIVLLGLGIAIGIGNGATGMTAVPPWFTMAFMGVLTAFLLDLGMTAAQRLSEVRAVGRFLVGFAIAMPLIHGVIGVSLGGLAGLSVGGATVLGVMAASASYIAAPAAVRIALPNANPSYYLTASIGITFPFNLAVGIPLMYAMATWMGA